MMRFGEVLDRSDGPLALEAVRGRLPAAPGRGA